MAGIKINAIRIEALNTAINVIGINFINCPGTPGQKSKGMKTAIMVTIEVMTGQAMRCAA